MVMPTFTAMMSKQFKRTDQKLQEFAEELRALSMEDKMWYWKHLLAEGYECSEPSPPKN